MSRPASAFQGMFQFKPAPPDRVRFSLRAGACIGAPVLAGWLAGDISAGMMVAIGGFTALYGGGRAYAHRALQLAVIAFAFALATALGMWSSAGGWSVALPVIALVAVVATWIGNALRIGPPGAYMFMLACAAATAMPAGPLSPTLAALLVAAGGGFSWLVHMSGALIDVRGPERKAARGAGNAVIAYAAAIGAPGEGAARRQAAYALQNAWDVLVNQQPPRVRGSVPVGRLRTLVRGLHLAFADAMGTASRGAAPDPALAQHLQQLLSAIDTTDDVEVTGHDEVPPGHPRAREALLDALRPGSSARRILVRVAIAALLAGGLASLLHLERAYWAVAAAVLLLFQGFDWVRMVQRSTERLIGTWVGLLLGGAILAWHPQGLWLVLVIVALQFTVEMLVMRNYAIAVIFITSAALTLASGGHPVPDVPQYVLARGVDTLLGVVVALLVYRALPPRPATVTLPEQLRRTIAAVAALVPTLASGNVTAPEARALRGTVQQAAMALVAAHEAGLAGSRSETRAAEEAWPAIVSADRLAYRALSACWALEGLGGRSAMESARAMFADGGARRLQAALAALADAVGNDSIPPDPGPLPHVLEVEVRSLRECLIREPAEVVPAVS
ncbi:MULTISPECIES: FUSC family protein [unclassified Luteimonas]